RPRSGKKRSHEWHECARMKESALFIRVHSFHSWPSSSATDASLLSKSVEEGGDRIEQMQRTAGGVANGVGHVNVGKDRQHQDHAKRQRDEKDDVDQLALEFQVHEIQGDEGSLDAGDEQGEQDVYHLALEAVEGNDRGEDGQHDEQDEDRQVVHGMVRRGDTVAVRLLGDAGGGSGHWGLFFVFFMQRSTLNTQRSTLNSVAR